MLLTSTGSILVLWFRFRQGRMVRRLHDLTMGKGMMKISNAFASYSVDDLKGAKAFYGDLLGLSVKETPEGLSLQFQNSIVYLYPKPNHQWSRRADVALIHRDLNHSRSASFAAGRQTARPLSRPD